MYKTDVEILEGLRKNEDSAFRIIYKQHYSVILHFIISNNGNEQEAKDIFQDAIIVLYKKSKDKSFKLECKIRTYLYSVCRRLWLSELKNKHKNSIEITDCENFLIFNDKKENDFLLREQQINIMKDSLEILGQPCSTILKDFYIKKLSMQQIADKMGYTNSENAKNQKYKCLQRLRKIYFKNSNNI